MAPTRSAEEVRTGIAVGILAAAAALAAYLGHAWLGHPAVAAASPQAAQPAHGPVDDDLRRLYGEDFFEHGVVHPITHTLDLAYAHHCTAQLARAVGDHRLAADLERRAGGPGQTAS